MEMQTGSVVFKAVVKMNLWETLDADIELLGDLGITY
jgi:hypothetical protein